MVAMKAERMDVSLVEWMDEKKVATLVVMTVEMMVDRMVSS